MQVHWHPELRVLKVKGSLPYFLQGHNFSFSSSDYVEGIGILQDLIGVGLWDAEINTFEYGCVFPIDGKPADYIRNHNALPNTHLYMNERGKYKGAFRWWENPTRDLKMYDAKKNIMLKQNMKTREAIAECGYNPELQYLKFELRHKKPHLLNGGRILVLYDLQNPDFLHQLSGTLIDQYHMLKPVRTLVQPTCKKNLSALDIVASRYVESLINCGFPIEEAKKNIYAYTNRLGCLDKRDKDSRKATIRRVFGKMQETEESHWDLTHKIEEALAVEGHPVHL